MKTRHRFNKEQLKPTDKHIVIHDFEVVIAPLETEVRLIIIEDAHIAFTRRFSSEENAIGYASNRARTRYMARKRINR